MWMWHLDHETSRWFEQVKEEREAERNDRGDTREKVPMMSNAHADGRRG